MRYVLVCEKCGDIFTVEFKRKEDATKSCREQWRQLSDIDKKKSVFYVLKSDNADVNAVNHLDGTMVHYVREL